MPHTLGIACAMHTGGAIQCVDLQPGVVGKDGQMIACHHILRLLQGVALQRVGRFWYVGVAVDIVQRQYLKLVAQNLAYLL